MCYAINSYGFRRKKYFPLREFISDVVMSRGNRRFLLTNLQAQIRGVTILNVKFKGDKYFVDEIET